LEDKNCGYLKKYDDGEWIDIISLRVTSNTRSCKEGNEPPDSMKDG
jgi:hypothetical protein